MPRFWSPRQDRTVGATDDVSSIVSLRVTPGQISRIQTGMTKSEVVAILGRPHFRNESDDGWHYWAWSNGGDPYFLSFDDDGYLVNFG